MLQSNPTITRVLYVITASVLTLVFVALLFLPLTLEESLTVGGLAAAWTGYAIARGYAQTRVGPARIAWLAVPFSAVIVTCAFAVFHRVAPQFWIIAFIVPVYIALVYGWRWTLIAGFLVVAGHLGVEFVFHWDHLAAFEEIIGLGAFVIVTVLAGWLGEMTHRATRRQTAFARLASAINQSLALNYVLTIAADEALLLARADALAIYAREEQQLVLRAHRGWDAGLVDQLYTFQLGEGIIGRTAQTGASEMSASRLPLAAPFTGLSAMIAAPLTARGHALGVLMLARRKREFSATDTAVIHEIANLLATAMMNAHFYDEAQTHARRLARLNEFAAALSRELPVTELQQVALRAIAESVGAPAAWIMQNDPHTNLPSLMADYGLPAVLGRYQRRDIRGHACECQKRLLAQQLTEPVQLQACDRLAQLGIESAHISVPLKSNERVNGMVTVLLPAQMVLSSENTQMLAAMGAQLGVALERARLRAELASRHLREQAALLRFSQDLAGIVEMERVLERAAEVARQLFIADGVAVSVLDEATGSLTLRAGRGWEFDPDKTAAPDPNDAVYAHVLHTGETVALEDALHAPQFAPTSLVRERAFRALLIAPLTVEHGVLGALALYFRATRAFAQDDVRLIELIANQTALAFARARRHAEAETRSNRLAVLREIDHAIASTLSLHEQLDVLLEQTRTQMRVDLGSVYLLDASDNVLHLAAQRGARHPELWCDLQFQIGQGASGWVAQQNQSLTILEIRQDTRWYHSHVVDAEGLVSYLGTPLRLGDQLIGILAVTTRTRRAFTRDDFAFFETLAGHAAIAIQNARRFEETQQRAEELGTLFDTARQMASESDPTRLMETILDHAIALLKTRGGAIHLYDSTQDETTPMVAREIVFPLGRLPLGEGLVGRVAASRQPLIVESYQTWEHRNVRLGATSLAAMIAVPLLYGGDLIGVLALHELDDSPRRFTDADVRLLSLLAANAAAALRNALLLQNERAARGELSALYTLARDLADAPNDRAEILPLITQRALQVVKVTCARVLLLEDAQWVVHAASPIRVLNFDLELGVRYACADLPVLARVIAQHAPMLVRADAPALNDAERAALLLDLTRYAYAIPLWVGDHAVGLLILHEARAEMREPFTPEKLALAHGLADQLSSALHRVELFARLEHSYLETVLALANAVDAKDSYTGNHSERIAELATAVGEALNLSAHDLEELRYAGILHDIGKIGVSDEVLKKPGKLDPDQWTEMRQHPEIGARILAPMPRLANTAHIVRHHHERYDGAGYPDGLAGEAIPLGARILAVVDSFSAMVDRRVYRAGKPIAEALAELRRCAGAQFDPQIVQVFLEIVHAHVKPEESP